MILRLILAGSATVHASAPQPAKCEATTPITSYGSRNAFYASIKHVESRAKDGAVTDELAVGCIRFAPGGLVGMHAANPDQIFLVTQGSGWVRTGKGAPARPIAQGEQIVWRAGEHHESGSEHGMSVLVTEGRELP